jgi:hypothetical protein
LPRLVRLALNGAETPLRPSEIAVLLDSDEATRLVGLDLCACGLLDTSVHMLARSPRLTNLTMLRLDEKHDEDWRGSRLSGAATLHIAGSPYLDKLVELGLACQMIEDDAFDALANASFASRLRVLHVGALSDGAAARVADAFPSLVALHVEDRDSIRDHLDALRAVIPDVIA